MNIGTRDTVTRIAGIAVLTTAAEIFRHCTKDPSEFCVQSYGDEHIVFGSVNRVVWNVWTGFHILRSSCTPSFIEKWDTWEMVRHD